MNGSPARGLQSDGESTNTTVRNSSSCFDGISIVVLFYIVHLLINDRYLLEALIRMLVMKI